jgi:hypothetical protein
VKLKEIAAIMDEAYTSIRLTESVLYWVKDTMELRYLGLERLQRDMGEVLFNVKFTLDESMHTRGVTYCMFYMQT